jgi:hypothetical protein
MAIVMVETFGDDINTQKLLYAYLEKKTGKPQRRIRE